MEMENNELISTLHVEVCGFQASGAEWLHSIIEYLLQHSEVPGSCSRVDPAANAGPGGGFDPQSHLVVVMRQPRDVAAAVYQQRGYSATCGFAEFLQHFLGKYGASELSWVDSLVQCGRAVATRAPGQAHVVRFEQLVSNLGAAVRDVCEFLGLSLSSKLAEQVVSTFDLDKFFQPGPERKRRKLGHTDARTHVNIHEVGLWKHYFTVRLSEEFNEALNQAIGQDNITLLQSARLIP